MKVKSDNIAVGIRLRPLLATEKDPIQIRLSDSEVHIRPSSGAPRSLSP